MAAKMGSASSAPAAIDGDATGDAAAIAAADTMLFMIFLLDKTAPLAWALQVDMTAGGSAGACAVCNAPGGLAGLREDEDNRTAPGALMVSVDMVVLTGVRPLTAAPTDRAAGG
ncbi:hypothetical protein [Bradyrhizobium zhanjiangense]|uniref:Uncharacterized protein n=1 Tax=Bradyrhizobium zhanjiangense TaxID=1325107 RepID=A0A4V1L4F7_9BRAD|nr:hypothetical protein [Bradyrhizobium zhanjiangense]RXH41314.1 hypothetical protein XH94_09015 [Bradyrhizobium zhanjiangense]